MTSRISPDELILVSVDDHICEPANMFDAHVPAKYREHTPRVVDETNGSQQWYYGNIRGRNLGLNAVAGKPPEMFNVDPLRYEHMRPGSTVESLGKLIEELEETCEKFEIAKVRRLERERKVAEKKAAKNLLVTSSAS